MFGFPGCPFPHMISRIYARFVSQKRVSCLHREFDIWRPFDDGMNFIDESIIRETVSDHNAFQVSFEAYQELRDGAEVKLPGAPHLTPEQYFFVLQSFHFCNALPYDKFKTFFRLYMSLPMSFIRVNSGVAHSPEFMKAFNCTKKNKLSRKKPCRVFD